MDVLRLENLKSSRMRTATLGLDSSRIWFSLLGNHIVSEIPEILIVQGGQLPCLVFQIPNSLEYPGRQLVLVILEESENLENVSDDKPILDTPQVYIKVS